MPEAAFRDARMHAQLLPQYIGRILGTSSSEYGILTVGNPASGVGVGEGSPGEGFGLGRFFSYVAIFPVGPMKEPIVASAYFSNPGEPVASVSRISASAYSPVV
jgi:hypothetical protein